MNGSLHEKLTVGKFFLGGHDCYSKLVPTYIKENLNPNFELRPYQLEAFGRFIYYLEKYDGPKNLPLRALFHMATGSGKTLIIAGLVLYLYKLGYRNFLFFVNSDSVINQTRNIFTNPHAPKYLFNDSIQIDGYRVAISEATTIRSVDSDNINIVFSTIQGLHSRLNTPRENSVTYEELGIRKFVLISDEAHHINVDTRKGRSSSQKSMFPELSNWELTVEQIFKSNIDNILLELTATMDLNNSDIWEKYHDKLIFDYPLKEFRLDKYSKEVKVLQSDLGQFERALQAMIISQLRRKIFNKHRILIKPVILFKSKTIAESKSFHEIFVAKVRDLNGDDFVPFMNSSQVAPVIADLFEFLQDNGIQIENFIAELKEDFAENKCISVDSQNDSKEKQIAINTLEEHNNEFRAVFAVDKLNEGWDVLNLFDIVRLYDTRDAKQGRPGKTTMSEAQLIGRGARYCPFKVEEGQSVFQRKYDAVSSNTESELKLCEELYYHSAHNPKYIQELKSALVETGILPNLKVKRKMALKPEFVSSSFYRNGFVFKNRRQKFNRDDVTGISLSFIETIHQIRIQLGYSQESRVFEDEVKPDFKISRKEYSLISFGYPIIKKALNRLPAFRFQELRKWYPQLKSITEFIRSDRYLGKVRVEVEGPENRVFELLQDDKLFLAVSLLEKLFQQLRGEFVEYRGSREFDPHSVANTFIEKTLNFGIDSETQERGIAQSQTSNSQLRLDLSDQNWFVFNECFGTSEEKHFVKFMNQVIPELRQQYQQIYLFRNERHLQIFHFEDGRAFEPDFILFLLDETGNEGMQVFIEPKGSHLTEHDKWKEDLLLQISDKHTITKLKDRNYVLWGLPFYNSKEKYPHFNNTFHIEILNDELKPLID